MAKFFTVLVALMVTASLHAVVVRWSTPTPTAGGTWSDLTWMSGGKNVNLAFQFVYSADALGPANDTGWSGTVSTIAARGEGYTYASSQSWVGSDASATFATDTAAKGYYYLVVFTTNKETSAVVDYAVIGGLQRDNTTPAKTGIYDTTVDGTKIPESGAYLDLSTLTNPWQGIVASTPEPTVLALLALGVAGLALRRKNF